MLIYNITTKISWAIDEEWVRWMKEEHIPGIVDTGCFVDHRFVKLLETDETEGPTYATQFYANTRGDYERYIEMHATDLRNSAAAKWGDQFISFRSLMELVN